MQTRRTESQIISDMEAALRARRSKAIERALKKSSTYMKALVAARRAVFEVSTQPDWPMQESFSRDMLNVIQKEIGGLVESHDETP